MPALIFRPASTTKSIFKKHFKKRQHMRDPRHETYRSEWNLGWNMIPDLHTSFTKSGKSSSGASQHALPSQPDPSVCRKNKKKIYIYIYILLEQTHPASLSSLGCRTSQHEDWWRMRKLSMNNAFAEITASRCRCESARKELD